MLSVAIPENTVNSLILISLEWPYSIEFVAVVIVSAIRPHEATSLLEHRDFGPHDLGPNDD